MSTTPGDVHLEAYDRSLLDRGDTAGSARSPNDADRRTRFDAMLDVIDRPRESPVVLCDFACGAGDLLAHIRSRGLPHITYIGADRSAEALAHARARFPDATFVEVDIDAPNAGTRCAGAAPTFGHGGASGHGTSWDGLGMHTLTLANGRKRAVVGQPGRVCLVTGGAGFIGCALSPALVAQFNTVVALDNLHPQIHATQRRPPALHSGVHLVVGDVTHNSVWDRLLASCRPDVIIHLAAETGTGQSLRDSGRHAQANVCGTTAMLDGLTRAGFAPAQFVLASSRAVYGEGGWTGEAGHVVYPRIRNRRMLAEGRWDFPGLAYAPCRAGVTWPQPCNVYGATKLAQEHILGAWCAAHGSELSILRLQNVFGPGQSLNNSYTGIVPLFCRLARAGQPIPLYEDGAMLRDFVHIDNVAAALSLAATGPALSAPIDIGTGRAVPIGDAARAIALRYGSPPPAITGQYRFGDVRHASCDLESTFRVLPGWRPRFSFEETLEPLVAWIEAQLRKAAA